LKRPQHDRAGHVFLAEAENHQKKEKKGQTNQEKKEGKKEKHVGSRKEKEKERKRKEKGQSIWKHSSSQSEF
jgi:hypothetical protein